MAYRDTWCDCRRFHLRATSRSGVVQVPTLLSRARSVVERFCSWVKEEKGPKSARYANKQAEHDTYKRVRSLVLLQSVSPSIELSLRATPPHFELLCRPQGD